MDVGVVMKKLSNTGSVISTQDQVVPSRSNSVPKTNLFGDIKSILRNASQRRNYPQIEEITSKASSVKNLTIVKSNDKSSVKNPEQKTEQKKIIIKVSTTQKIASLYLKAIYDVFHLYQKSNNSLVQFAAFLFGFTIAAVMVILPPSWFFIPYMISRKDTAVSQANRSNDSLKPFVDTILEAFMGSMKPISSEMKEISLVASEHKASIDAFTRDLKEKLKELQANVDNFQQKSGTIQKEANHVIKEINAQKKEFVDRFNKIVEDIFQDLSRKAANHYTEHKSHLDIEVDDWIGKIENLDLPEKNELLAELDKLGELKSAIHKVDIEFKAEANDHLKTEVKQHKLDQKRKDYTIFNQRITECRQQDETRLQDIIRGIKIKLAQNSGEWEQLMNDQITKYANHVQTCEKEIDQVVGGLEGIQFSLTTDNVNKRAVKSAKEKLIEVKVGLNKQLTSLKEKLQEKINKNKSENKRFQEQDVTNFSEEISNLIITDNKNVLSKRNIYFKAHIKAEYLVYQQHQINIELELKELSDILDTYAISEESRRVFLRVTKRIEEDNTSINQYYDRLNGAEELTSDEVKSFVDGTNRTQEEEVNLVNSLKQDILDQVALSIKQRILNANSKYKESVESLNKQIEQLLIKVKDHDNVLGIEQKSLRTSLRELTERLAKKIDDFELAAKALTNNPEVLFSKEVNDFIERTVQQSDIDIKDYKEIEAAINNKIQEKLKKQLDEIMVLYKTKVDDKLSELETLLKIVAEAEAKWPKQKDILVKVHESILLFQGSLLTSYTKLQAQKEGLKKSKNITKSQVEKFAEAVNLKNNENVESLQVCKIELDIKIKQIAWFAVLDYKDHAGDIEDKLKLLELKAAIFANKTEYLEAIEFLRNRLVQNSSEFEDGSDAIKDQQSVALKDVEYFTDEIGYYKDQDLIYLEEITGRISAGIKKILESEQNHVADYDKHARDLVGLINKTLEEVENENYLSTEKSDLDRLADSIIRNTQIFEKDVGLLEENASHDDVNSVSTRIRMQIEDDVNQYQRILDKIDNTRHKYLLNLMQDKFKEYHAHVQVMRKEIDAFVEYGQALLREKRPLTPEEKNALAKAEDKLNNYIELMVSLGENEKNLTECYETCKSKTINIKTVESFSTTISDKIVADKNGVSQWKSQFKRSMDEYQYLRQADIEIQKYKNHKQDLSTLIQELIDKSGDATISKAGVDLISRLGNQLKTIQEMPTQVVSNVLEVDIPAQQVILENTVKTLIIEDKKSYQKLLKSLIAIIDKEYQNNFKILSNEFPVVRSNIGSVEEFSEEIALLTKIENEWKEKDKIIRQEHDDLMQNENLKNSEVLQYKNSIFDNLEDTKSQLRELKDRLKLKWKDLAFRSVDCYKTHLDSAISEALQIITQNLKFQKFQEEIVELHTGISTAPILTEKMQKIASKRDMLMFQKDIAEQIDLDQRKLDEILSKIRTTQEKSENDVAAVQEVKRVIVEYQDNILDKITKLERDVERLPESESKTQLTLEIDALKEEIKRHIAEFKRDSELVTEENKDEFITRVRQTQSQDTDQVINLREAYNKLKLNLLKVEIGSAYRRYEQHADIIHNQAGDLKAKFAQVDNLKDIWGWLEFLEVTVSNNKKEFELNSNSLLENLGNNNSKQDVEKFVKKISQKITEEKALLSQLELDINSQIQENLRDRGNKILQEYKVHTGVIGEEIEHLKTQFVELDEVNDLIDDLMVQMRRALRTFDSKLKPVDGDRLLTEDNIEDLYHLVNDQKLDDNKKLEEIKEAISVQRQKPMLEKFEAEAERYKEHADTMHQQLELIISDLSGQDNQEIVEANNKLYDLDFSFEEKHIALTKEIKSLAQNNHMDESDLQEFTELVDRVIQLDEDTLFEIQELINSALKNIASNDVDNYSVHLDQEFIEFKTELEQSQNTNKPQIEAELVLLEKFVHSADSFKLSAENVKSMRDVKLLRMAIVEQKENDKAELKAIRNKMVQKDIKTAIADYAQHVQRLEIEKEFYVQSIKDNGAPFDTIVNNFEGFGRRLNNQKSDFETSGESLLQKGEKSLTKEVLKEFNDKIVERIIKDNEEFAILVKSIQDSIKSSITADCERYQEHIEILSELIIKQEQIVNNRFKQPSISNYKIDFLKDSIKIQQKRIDSIFNGYNFENVNSSDDATSFKETINQAIEANNIAQQEILDQIKKEFGDWAGDELKNYKTPLQFRIMLIIDDIKSILSGAAQEQLSSEVTQLELEINQAIELTNLSAQVTDEDSALEFESNVADRKKLDIKKLDDIEKTLLGLVQNKLSERLKTLLTIYERSVDQSQESLEKMALGVENESLKKFMGSIGDDIKELQTFLNEQRLQVRANANEIIEKPEITSKDIEEFAKLTEHHIADNNTRVSQLQELVKECFRAAAKDQVKSYSTHLDVDIAEAIWHIKRLVPNSEQQTILNSLEVLKIRINAAESFQEPANNVSNAELLDNLSENIKQQKIRDQSELSELMLELEFLNLGVLGAGYQESEEAARNSAKIKKQISEHKDRMKLEITQLKKSTEKLNDGEEKKEILKQIEQLENEIVKDGSELDQEVNDNPEVKEEEFKKKIETKEQENQRKIIKVNDAIKAARTKQDKVKGKAVEKEDELLFDQNYWLNSAAEQVEKYRIHSTETSAHIERCITKCQSNGKARIANLFRELNEEIAEKLLHFERDLEYIDGIDEDILLWEEDSAEKAVRKLSKSVELAIIDDLSRLDQLIIEMNQVEGGLDDSLLLEENEEEEPYQEGVMYQPEQMVETVEDFKTEYKKLLEHYKVSPTDAQSLEIILGEILETPVRSTAKLYYILQSNQFKQYLASLFQVIQGSLESNYKEKRNVVFDKNDFLNIGNSYYYSEVSPELELVRQVSQQSISELAHLFIDLPIDPSTEIEFSYQTMQLFANLVKSGGGSASTKINDSARFACSLLNGVKIGDKITWGQIVDALKKLGEQSSISHVGQMHLINTAFMIANDVFGKNNDIAQLKSMWDSFIVISKTKDFYADSKIKATLALEPLLKEVNIDQIKEQLLVILSETKIPNIGSGDHSLFNIIKRIMVSHGNGTFSTYMYAKNLDDLRAKIASSGTLDSVKRTESYREFINKLLSENAARPVKSLKPDPKKIQLIQGIISNQTELLFEPLSVREKPLPVDPLLSKDNRKINTLNASLSIKTNMGVPELLQKISEEAEKLGISFLEKSIENLMTQKRRLNRNFTMKIEDRQALIKKLDHSIHAKNTELQALKKLQKAKEDAKRKKEKELKLLKEKEKADKKKHDKEAKLAAQKEKLELKALKDKEEAKIKEAKLVAQKAERVALAVLPTLCIKITGAVKVNDRQKSIAGLILTLQQLTNEGNVNIGIDTKGKLKELLNQLAPFSESIKELKTLKGNMGFKSLLANIKKVSEGK